MAIAILDIYSKCILNSKSYEILFSHNITYCSVVKWFCNFAQSTAVSLPCFVQIFNMIKQSKWMTCLSEISRDGLVQDCSNSSVLAVELLHYCAKPSILCNYLTFDISSSMTKPHFLQYILSYRFYMYPWQHVTANQFAQYCQKLNLICPLIFIYSKFRSILLIKFPRE